MSVDKELIQKQFHVLSLIYTWKIIAAIRGNTMFIKQIANHTQIPYTMVHRRVHQLAEAGLVTLTNGRCRRSFKYAINVTLNRFKIELEPLEIYENEAPFLLA